MTKLITLLKPADKFTLLLKPLGSVSDFQTVQILRSFKRLWKVPSYNVILKDMIFSEALPEG